MGKQLITGVKIWRNGNFQNENLLLSDGVIEAFMPCDKEVEAQVLDFSGCVLMPGLMDVHVHLREPGFSYKEEIATGTKAAAHGGYTLVCSMPNLSPTPDSVEHLAEQLDLIRENAVIRVVPYGCITVGQKGEELSDFEGMASQVAGFSDDGKGVQEEDMMRAAMERAKACGKMIVAHCEVNDLLKGGYIHDGVYAKEHGHRGICSESEWVQIERDLKLAKEIGCSYHVCHISTKESVELIRKAKVDGVDVTCETAPHYLVLCDEDLEEDGRFKMNPPLRSAEDRDALIAGIMDGTVDMIATDHAPHSAEEKGKGLEKSAMGVVGIETAFPVMYTEFVRKNRMEFAKLMELMYENPNRRFGFGQELKVGEKANFTIFDLDACEVVEPETFLSKGRSTPFAGRTVYGVCRMTVADGKTAYLGGKNN
ncbi:MAG: dihydroorotase [Ruminococcaceae bacterium]|nr:dihydroorotase [Oscillospiraceae bacterium]